MNVKSFVIQFGEARVSICIAFAECDERRGCNVARDTFSPVSPRNRAIGDVPETTLGVLDITARLYFGRLRGRGGGAPECSAPPRARARATLTECRLISSP